MSQIELHGLCKEQVERQIENFRQGFPFLKVVRAASVGDGVLRLDAKEVEAAVKYYDKAADELDVVKFVPASGAATRMFKELFEFVNEDKYTPGIERLLDNIEKFAFWDELKEYIVPDSPEEEIVEAIIKTGLDYGSKPKGLVTMATVRISISFAARATIGAAPVPVPPPIPAVTNTISAPVSISLISSMDSSAERAPISGLAPAPKPLVIFSPITS